jgi:hypothetical protein
MHFFLKIEQFKQTGGIFIPKICPEILFHRFENISSWLYAFQSKFLNFHKFKVSFLETKKKIKILVSIVTALRKLIIHYMIQIV